MTVSALVPVRCLRSKIYQFKGCQCVQRVLVMSFYQLNSLIFLNDHFFSSLRIPLGGLGIKSFWHRSWFHNNSSWWLSNSIRSNLLRGFADAGNVGGRAHCATVFINMFQIQGYGKIFEACTVLNFFWLGIFIWSQITNLLMFFITNKKFKRFLKIGLELLKVSGVNVAHDFRGGEQSF